MYASFSNHLEQGLHYAFAFILLFWLWPKVLFRRVDGDATERAAANFLFMVLLAIAMGYTLVILKLHEIITIVSILTLMALYRWSKALPAETRSEKLRVIATVFFDYFEKKFSLRAIAAGWAVKQADEVRREWRQRLASSGSFVETALLLIVAAGAVYVRFYDAIVYSVPGMSDGNVTLLWMKWIDDRELFHDGIYPQGFHIYLNMLFKFASIDGLYIQKYSGPLNSVLTMIGIHFLVSRLSGNRLAGVVSAFVFGWLGAFVGNGWERQAATNSQEFAMVMVFPALYFYHRFLQSGQRQWLWPAVAGLLATGLVHTFVFGFLIMAVAMLSVAHWLGDIRGAFRRILWVVGTGAVSGAASFVPIGIGLLLGKHFQSSSAEFLTGSTGDSIFYPALSALDYSALAAAALLLIGGLAAWKRPAARVACLFGALLTAATFALYYWGASLTQNIVIATRSGDVWSLALPFAIGMGWGAAAAPVARFRLAKAASPVLLAGLMAFSFVRFPLEPIVPYKMQAHAMVEQYLRISELHRPKTWAIFSQEEGFAIIKGKGNHQYIQNFLKWYNPKFKYLTRYGENKPDRRIAGDVYVYLEKEVYRVSRDNGIYETQAAIYERREREMRQLSEWIAAYEKFNGKAPIFYEDEQLRIYHFHRPLSREEVMDTIWDGGREEEG